MSKLLSKLLLIPDSVRIYIKKNSGVLIFASSEITWGIKVPKFLKIEKIKNNLVFTMEPKHRIVLNTYYYLSRNLIHGVVKPYNNNLLFKGLGFRVQDSNSRNLIVKLGFSHPVKLLSHINNVEISALKPTILSLSSVSKQSLGNIAYNIRKLRKPNAYKGKGVLFRGEKLQLKIGKKS